MAKAVVEKPAPLETPADFAVAAAHVARALGGAMRDPLDLLDQ